MAYITTKSHGVDKTAWKVQVDGRFVGFVRQRPSGEFVGIASGTVYGPFPSNVQATDAVAEVVL
jgi:hypothetical protein